MRVPWRWHAASRALAVGSVFATMAVLACGSRTAMPTMSGANFCGPGTEWSESRQLCEPINIPLRPGAESDAGTRGNVATGSPGVVGVQAPAGPMDDSDRVPFAGAPSIGPSSALVTMVYFSDFQCPYCARVEPTLAALRERYGNDLRIVFRHQPLSLHDRAQESAEASMEIFAQQGNDGFWRFHDLLFQNQGAPGGLDRAALERYAQMLGADLARFRSALDQRTHQARVQRDIDLAIRLNAEGVPSFFINGTQLVGARPIGAFVATIDRVLERARSITPRDRVYAAMVANPIAGDEAPQAPAAPSPPTQALDPNATYRVSVAGAPQLGRSDAVVTIVTFSDFECPFCERVQPTLAQIRARYGRDVRLVFRHQPLPFHPRAMLAAEAAAEAYSQRGDAGFWQMHDLLFQNQRSPAGLERPALEQYARQLGLDFARFQSALDQHTHQASIQRDMQLASQLGANGTPHFFINGRRFVGAQPVDRFVAAIDEARRIAEARVHSGTPRAAVYDAITSSGATGPVYLPGAMPGAAGGVPGGDEFAAVYNIAPNPNAPTRGPSSAAVTIEMFTDFQCPFCARVLPTLEQVLHHYGARVRLVHRDYPLVFHPNARPAAEAAREVLAQRGATSFWRFTETLFQNQERLDSASLERYAAIERVDMARFRRALAQHTHAAAVQADIAAADRSGASIGTPSFFVNGHLIQGAVAFEEFRRRIDSILGGAAGNTAVGAAAP